MGERPYTLSLHRHRLAAWAACTAARASKKCRFSVELGARLIEETGLNRLAAGWGAVPNPESFDANHRVWRTALVEAAPAILSHKKFTHGVAAKLINCYLKVLFLGGVHAPTDKHRIAKRDAIHPPIDSVLLKRLAKCDVGGYRQDWTRFERWRWSAYTCEQYEEVISAVRSVEKNGLWRIERHWPGFR